MINYQEQKGNKLYERPFEERKLYGDRGEDCFAEYLKTKYDLSQITQRQKEKQVDFKLPDFVVKTSEKVFEFEVKTTNKIKYRDYLYQLQYAVENKLLLYYIYLKILDSHKFTFRPIEVRNLLDYRVLFQDGVYEDSILKPYFVVNWNLSYGKDYEKNWIDHQLP